MVESAVAIGAVVDRLGIRPILSHAHVRLCLLSADLLLALRRHKDAQSRYCRFWALLDVDRIDHRRILLCHCHHLGYRHGREGGNFSSYCLVKIVIETIVQRKAFRVTSTRASSTQEISLVAQASLISINLELLIIIWQYYYLLFPETKWTYFGLNLWWMSISWVHPFIYLVLNRYPL